ncbi:hypothetical protein AAF712_012180 [Marasmius tenuissimus]|uniref:Uncharacterized protein n=1 Tax=Marasmius tenuissimus TaxID=585030 RepID=A0ABR2ZH75_9AGAR
MHIIVDHSLALSNALPLSYPLSLAEGLFIRDQAMTRDTKSSGSTTAQLLLSSITSFSQIQASAQDSTALNTDENSDQVAEEDESTGILEDDAYELAQIVPATLNEDQCQSINAQIQSKIQHKTAQLLPRLHGLNALLRDLPELENPADADILELEGVVEMMQAWLKDLCSGSLAEEPQNITTEAVDLVESDPASFMHPQTKGTKNNTNHTAQHSSGLY